MEQYYQYRKAEITNNEPAARKLILEADPLAAKRIGDRIQVPHSSAWHHKQDEVMKEAVFLKFQQNGHLSQFLVDTEDATLVEATNNTRWGAGCSLWSKELKTLTFRGQNKLGKILMDIRTQLRK